MGQWKTGQETVKIVDSCLMTIFITCADYHIRIIVVNKTRWTKLARCLPCKET
jgi:hypothetical protein